ncbi:iron hydrogenase [bacterium]|nr:iron hydrogenase [bacterium]
MKETKTYITKPILLDKTLIWKLAVFATLLGISITAPFLKQQALTGPLVNASLFVGVALLGTEATLLIGLLPSLFALSIGLLPAILAPMIPFIMTGNAILILAFGYLKNKNYWLGAISASFLKFIFLFASSQVVINLIIKKEIAAKATVMMSWPQLATALIGSFIAYFFLKIIKRII